MQIAKFDPKELEVKEVVKAFGKYPDVKVYNTPLNQHDHGVAAFKREPWWQMYELMDIRLFGPDILADNIARAFCMENKPFDALTQGGGKDMFGIEWEYVAEVGGSMVRPGNPLFSDISEWREKVQWPDVESWDWEGSAKLNNGTYLKPDAFNQFWFQTGWFERLISMMDFEDAALALFDEDSKDETHAFFDKLTDTYINIFDHVTRYFPEIHLYFIHDDWGSQKSPFFSPAICEEMIVPYMKRLTDFLHSKGKFCELHSCGCIIQQVPNMIAAGWDAWSGQPMNDSHAIYAAHGDKILIGVSPEDFDPVNDSEERQREVARNYANAFCNPNKPSYFGMYWNNKRNGAEALTGAFREELYAASRENYGK